MKAILIVCAVSTFMLTGCIHPTPLECEDPTVTNKIVEGMKRNLSVKTSMLLQQRVNPNDLQVNIESVKTLEKDPENLFYRKCELKFTMPGMFFSTDLNYEINKSESGELIVSYKI